MPPCDEPESLDHLLAQVSRLHHARAHELLEALGLYRGQPPVLRALWEREGLTHRELADRTHVTPATMTRMIQRMRKAGFVACRSDADDERISRVYLTEAGRAVQAEMQRTLRRLEAETFAGFSGEERALLQGYLLRLRGNLAEVTGRET